MSSGGFLLHDNMRGLLISQRPAEILAFKNSQVSPFMSRVNNSSPLGLPPIRNTMILPINNQVNYVDRKNKEIIRKLETLKKYEKNAVTDEEKNNKIKYEKAKIISNKQNTAINQMRKELYGDLVTSSPKHENKNTKKFGLTSIGFYDKKNSEANLLPCLETNVNMGESIQNSQNNPNVQAELKISKQGNESQNRKVNFNLTLTDDLDKLEKDENEHEINNLLNFVNNLDYEKYSKDLEIREALYLIKNKVEKDRINEEECKLPENQDNINYEENKNYESATIPPIPQQNQNGYNFPQDANMHDKDWDNSVKNQIIFNLKYYAHID